ncbi:SIMPL domain-containing protein [Candidatus Woesearchaeota archaeon]|nr:SIMPL domain-containing protein [Candidatus Woesearchaeota archaeon]
MKKTNYLTAIPAIGLVVVALFLAINSKSNVIVDQNGLQRETVSVSGTSTLTVDPNKAEVYVRIVTLEKTAQEAKNRNSEISKKVTDALKKLGVKDKEIETSQFNIYPKYDYEEVIDINVRKSKQVLLGYEVIHVLKVTTQDLEKVGKIIDASVDSDANDIDRISFGLTKEKGKEVKQQAMILASNDAKEKAVALVTNLGVSLGKPVSISESSFYYMPFDVAYKVAAMAREEAPAPSTVVSPQKLDVSASVQLVYEIR